MSLKLNTKYGEAEGISAEEASKFVASAASVANGLPSAVLVVPNGTASTSPTTVTAATQPSNGTADHADSMGSADNGRSSPSDPAPNKLFVGGLSWQTTPEKLRDYFSQYGTVTDVLIMKDPLTQRSRGFGFITFSDTSAVDKVLAVPCHLLDGKKIDPKHATPKSKKGTTKTKKIFVGGLSQETSLDEVKAYFAQFGKVEEAVLLMDNQTKRHRGFGFVTMASEDAVERICEIHYHMIKGKRVECKKALPREAVAAMTAAAQLAAPPGLPVSATALNSPLTAASLTAAANQNSLALLMARQRAIAAACGLPGVQATAAGMLSLLPPGAGPAGNPSPSLSHHLQAVQSHHHHPHHPSQSASGYNPSSNQPVVSSASIISPPSVTLPSHPATVSSPAYGKVLAYNGLSSAYRYSPYTIPQANPAVTAAATGYSAAAAAQAAANQAAVNAAAYALPAAATHPTSVHHSAAGIAAPGTAMDMSGKLKQPFGVHQHWTVQVPARHQPCDMINT
ncbi:unnamed protein product, partial [Cyprideis torosa]